MLEYNSVILKQTMMYGLIVWVSTSVGKLNMVYYCYVSRSCMLKFGTQKHPSFGWKYEKHLSSMHGERCCTIAFFFAMPGAVIVGKQIMCLLGNESIPFL